MNAQQVYAFERNVLSRFATPIDLDHARYIVKSIWSLHDGPSPVVRFGDGVDYRGKRVSYAWQADGRPRIVLAPGERDDMTLIHEAAHCCGHWKHDHDFMNRYMGLLAIHGIKGAIREKATDIRARVAWRSGRGWWRKFKEE